VKIPGDFGSISGRLAIWCGFENLLWKNEAPFQALHKLVTGNAGTSACLEHGNLTAANQGVN
jgi:hypothetical protein